MPIPVCVCPAGQAVNGVHDVAPEVVLNVPLMHGSQSLSFVELPIAARYCPAAHCVNAVHIAAFVVVVKPVLQVMQARSVVAVPSACTNSPGMHTVYGVQVLSVVDVPATEMNPVDPHDVHGAQAAAFAVALKVPAPQAAH